MLVLFFLVSFFASTIGAICGIGGGVIIKPVLDLLQLSGVSTISFLSGCTVLSMSLYSVAKSLLSGNNIDLKIVTALAFGASIGGLLGKELFTYISLNTNSMGIVGALQSAILVIITFGTLIYTILKQKIHTHHIDSCINRIIVGLVLGIISSFLGIGGGPINIIVLHFFFSMDTKRSAQSSLYIILFSQITSLLSTLITNSIPPFSYKNLIVMVAGGVIGGIIGQKFYKEMDNKTIGKLLIIIIIIIIITSIYNTYQYLIP
jgi:hypothetical protein